MKIIWNALIAMVIRGIGYGALFGALYGTGYVLLFGGISVYILIGVFYGVIFGGATGLITGITSGLAVGLVTRGCFMPLYNAALYRRVIGITSALVTFVTAEIALTLLVQGGINSPDGFTSFFFFLMPSLIAAVAATYAGLGFADRYIAKNRPHSPVKSIFVGA